MGSPTTEYTTGKSTTADALEAAEEIEANAEAFAGDEPEDWDALLEAEAYAAECRAGWASLCAFGPLSDF